MVKKQYYSFQKEATKIHLEEFPKWILISIQLALRWKFHLALELPLSCCILNLLAGISPLSLFSPALSANCPRAPCALTAKATEKDSVTVCCFLGSDHTILLQTAPALVAYMLNMKCMSLLNSWIVHRLRRLITNPIHFLLKLFSHLTRAYTVWKHRINVRMYILEAAPTNAISRSRPSCLEI